MVVRPRVRPERVTNFLKPYILKMHFTNHFVYAQVVHSLTATTVASASTLEKDLRLAMTEANEKKYDVAAAAKIGRILGARLLDKNIPAVTYTLKGSQKYHGKVKAVIDSVQEAGVKLI